MITSFYSQKNNEMLGTLRGDSYGKHYGSVSDTSNNIIISNVSGKTVGTFNKIYGNIYDTSGHLIITNTHGLSNANFNNLTVTGDITVTGKINSDMLDYVSHSTNNNVPSTLICRDSNGDFEAGVITANLFGNVAGELHGNVVGEYVSINTSSQKPIVLHDISGSNVDVTLYNTNGNLCLDNIVVSKANIVESVVSKLSIDTILKIYGKILDSSGNTIYDDTTKNITIGNGGRICSANGSIDISGNLNVYGNITLKQNTNKIYGNLYGNVYLPNPSGTGLDLSVVNIGATGIVSVLSNIFGTFNAINLIQEYVITKNAQIVNIPYNVIIAVVKVNAGITSLSITSNGTGVGSMPSAGTTAIYMRDLTGKPYTGTYVSGATHIRVA